MSKASQLSIEELDSNISSLCQSLTGAKKVLVIHPDYSRNDFTDLLAPRLIEGFEKNGAKRIDFLNAGGTHRKMTQDELIDKLGISELSTSLEVELLNHEFDDPEMIDSVCTLSSEFVAEKTSGNLKRPLEVTVNKLVFSDYDAILTISGTVPHEALGYSGGTKIFFPGIAGPELIGLLHWAAVLIGIPKIIGTVQNPAREVVNAGTKEIFKKIGNKPIVSLNMVYTEDDKHNALPQGLFIGEGFDGFQVAHADAASLSEELHINFIDRPMRRVVQCLPTMYDEVWTAGKGSYKLQRPGVLADGGEIILYAPHIEHFHSNSEMDKGIREIGYHGLEYVLAFLEKQPDFDRNIASHVINVRGFGQLSNDGVESFPFKVSLASKISKEDCEKVGLGYHNPDDIKREDFLAEDELWIEEGGQWLYSR